MHPRERVLELARLLLSRGRVLPVDLLADAERLGIDLKAMGQPQPTKLNHEHNKLGETDGNI